MNKPIKTLRLGGVSLSIWQNEGKNGQYFSFNIQKSYKQDDQWKNTTNLNEGDLYKVVHLINTVFSNKINKAKSTGQDTSNAEIDW